MYKQVGDFIITDDNLLRLESIRPGSYRMDKISHNGNTVPCLKPANPTESLVKFQHDGITRTMSMVRTFVESGDKFNRMGFCHKIGIIWHGPAGTGKTSAARIMMDMLVSDFGAICIDATEFSAAVIKFMATHIRKTQNNLIVIFVDECDTLLKDVEMLPFLDGSESISNSIFLGCTNFIDNIPDRIKNRPSRIRHVVEVSKMPFDVYKSFISAKMPEWAEAEVNKLAYIASEKSASMDMLKSALIDIEVHGTSIDKAMSGDINNDPDPEPPINGGFFIEYK